MCLEHGGVDGSQLFLQRNKAHRNTSRPGIAKCHAHLTRPGQAFDKSAERHRHNGLGLAALAAIRAGPPRDMPAVMGGAPARHVFVDKV